MKRTSTKGRPAIDHSKKCSRRWPTRRACESWRSSARTKCASATFTTAWDCRSRRCRAISRICAVPAWSMRGAMACGCTTRSRAHSIRSCSGSSMPRWTRCRGANHHRDRKQFKRAFGQLYVLEVDRWRVLRPARRRTINGVEAATARDLPGVRTLLERHDLPLDGVDEHVQTMVVARDESRMVGAAALELYGDGALLRSVAVDSHGRARASAISSRRLRCSSPGRMGLSRYSC